ncbi:hypothetical protein TSUD_234370 [Trifolium subterraneum]|uniref:Uncharacterized protein n=1 Tax=Trifolium subterraneum TaxID=3900 RepID=A0A2Z6MHL9_TRISU|nr:hypothetical protein TSUD_234370 [Trifolium subterraneum]
MASSTQFALTLIALTLFQFLTVTQFGREFYPVPEHHSSPPPVLLYNPANQMPSPHHLHGPAVYGEEHSALKIPPENSLA